MRSGGLLTPDPCCVSAGQVSGYDVVANGASTALLNMTATGPGFGSAARQVAIYLDCQILGTAASSSQSHRMQVIACTLLPGRQRIQQHYCSGSRKLLAAGDFLAVTSGAAGWVDVSAVTLGDLEFSFDADDGSGVAKGYVFLNGTAEPLAGGNSSGQRVAGGTPITAQHTDRASRVGLKFSPVATHAWGCA